MDDRVTVPPLASAQHHNWSSIPIEYPATGIERQLVVGQQVMICRFRFAPQLVTPQQGNARLSY